MMAVVTERMCWEYRLSWWFFGTILRVWNSYHAYAPENVPRNGPCIVVANHGSFLDPLVVACGVPFRQIFFMGRRSLSKNRLMHWWMTSIGVVYIDRDRGDIGALKAGLKLLKQGLPLFLFPEGTRTLDGNLQPAKGGVGFLIAKAQVPVVPVYIKGTFEAFPKGARKVRRAPISVWYGKAIQPEELREHLVNRDGYLKIGELVMERIAGLKANADACAPGVPGNAG